MIDGYYITPKTTDISKMSDIEIIDELESYNHLFGKIIKTSSNTTFLVKFQKSYKLMGYKRLNTIYWQYQYKVKAKYTVPYFEIKKPTTSSASIGFILKCFRGWETTINATSNT